MSIIHPGDGQNAWTLYCFGNSQVLYDILMGLKALTNSGLFIHLIDLTLIMSLGWSLFIASSKGVSGVNKTTQWILSTGLLVRFILGFTVNIALEDYLTLSNNYIVTNIPAVIGLPASIISQVGYQLSVLFDEVYSSQSNFPISLTMTGGKHSSAGGAPFNFTAQLLLDGANFRILDPYLKNSMNHFVTDCMVPLIASNRFSSTDILMSQELWKLVGSQSINPSLMTVYYGTQNSPSSGNNGLIVSCLEAYKQINTHLILLGDNAVENHFGNELTSGIAGSLFETILNYNAQNSAYKTTASGYLIQSALIDVMQTSAPSLMANLTNSSALLDSMHFQQAERSTTASWMMTARIFNATFGYLYSGMQVLIYALAPLLLILMLLPGNGLTVFVNYLQLLAWFPICMVLLAITNNILGSWTHQAIQPIWEQYHGNTVVGKAFISVQAAKMVEVGAWLNTLAPMLAWFLVSRTRIAMTDLIATANNNTFAQQAATGIVAGEVALGNQSYSNINANSFNSTLRTDMGALPVNMNMQGSAINASANLGGRSFLVNNTLAAHTTSTNKTNISERYAENIIGNGDNTSKFRNEVDTQTTRLSKEGIQSVSRSLNSRLDGGLAVGIATFLKQQKLAQEFHLSMPVLNDVADKIASASVLSAKAANASAGSHPEQSSGYIKLAEADLSSAYHSLINNMGGGKAAAVAAGAIIAAGTVAVAVAAVPEEVIGAAGGVVLTGTRQLGKFVSTAFKGASQTVGIDAARAEEILQAGVTDYEAGSTATVSGARSASTAAKTAENAEKVMVTSRAGSGRNLVYQTLLGAFKLGISGSESVETLTIDSNTQARSNEYSSDNISLFDRHNSHQNNNVELIKTTTTEINETVIPTTNPVYPTIFNKAHTAAELGKVSTENDAIPDKISHDRQQHKTNERQLQLDIEPIHKTIEKEVGKHET
jgi:hypothetical protein